MRQSRQDVKSVVRERLAFLLWFNLPIRRSKRVIHRFCLETVVVCVRNDGIFDHLTGHCFLTYKASEAQHLVLTVLTTAAQ